MLPFKCIQDGDLELNYFLFLEEKNSKVRAWLTSIVLLFGECIFCELPEYKFVVLPFNTVEIMTLGLEPSAIVKKTFSEYKDVYSNMNDVPLLLVFVIFSCFLIYFLSGTHSFCSL
jgi:hypothetical protein